MIGVGKMLISYFLDELFAYSHSCLSYIDIYNLAHVMFIIQLKLYINFISLHNWH